MEVKGKITQKLDVQTGESKSGKEWKKREIVIDTGAQYNPLICISFFGDEKVGILEKYNEGDQVEVAINISSREFNGKWYHSIDGWKIKKAESQPVSADEETDDLPF